MSCNWLEGCLGSDAQGITQWVLFSFLLLLMVFVRTYDDQSDWRKFEVGNLFVNLILITVFITPVFSHIWHILYGEGSITQFSDGNTLLAIFDLGDYDGDILSTDSPYFDTWEFTVALELFFLKALGGFLLSTEYLGASASSRNDTASPLSLSNILYADAVLSLLMFGFIIPFMGGGGLFLLFSLIGLIVSSLLFLLIYADVMSTTYRG